MGAWGVGHFENDDALDFLSELEEDPSVLSRCLADTATSKDYFDSPAGTTVLAAAALVANQVDPSVEVPEEARTWANANVTLSSELIQDAIKSVDRILNEEDSELASLWAETDDNTDWQTECQHLKESLKRGVS